MKRLFLFTAILFLIYSCHQFKFQGNEITHLHIMQKAMTGDAETDSLLQKLCKGTGYIKVRIISGYHVSKNNMNYYAVELYDEDDYPISLEKKRAGLFMETIKVIPEYLLY